MVQYLHGTMGISFISSLLVSIQIPTERGTPSRLNLGGGSKRKHQAWGCHRIGTELVRPGGCNQAAREETPLVCMSPVLPTDCVQPTSFLQPFKIKNPKLWTSIIHGLGWLTYNQMWKVSKVTWEERLTHVHLSPFNDSIKGGGAWRKCAPRSYPLTSAWEMHLFDSQTPLQNSQNDNARAKWVEV